LNYIQNNMKIEILVVRSENYSMNVFLTKMLLTPVESVLYYKFMRPVTYLFS